MYKFGFIGTGNMGSAIAKAAVKAVGKESIMLSNRTEEKAKILADSIGCKYGDGLSYGSGKSTPGGTFA